VSIQILHGDCRDVLRTLADASVQCCVTSPPYFGLRDYGVDGQIGLEQTPDAYVAELVAVFREVRRVLRDDGTLWLNLGDSYNAHPGQRKVTDKAGAKQQTNGGSPGAPSRNVEGLKPKDLIGIPWMSAFALRADGWLLRRDIIWSKPNPMPESVTDRPTTAHEYVFLFAKSGDHTFWTHRDGPGAHSHPEPDYRWIHRETKEETRIAPSGSPEDIKKIWRRVNLWTGHDYFWDAEAVREPMAAASIARLSQDVENQTGSLRANGGAKTNGAMKAVAKGNAKTFRGGGAYTRGQSFDNDTPAERDSHGNAPNESCSRNLRSVWTIATQPFSESHFATFPPALVETCIKAGTSEKGCCSACGAPWARVTTKGEPDMAHRLASGADVSGGYGGQSIKGHDAAGVQNASDVKRRILEGMREKAYSWAPTCECGAEVVPCTVLDPFAGAATSLMVADRLGRDAIGIELNADYIDIAKRRLTKDAGMFAEITA
jgi:DNA modification methylase